MTRLLAAVRDAGRDFCEAARAVGARPDFDAEAALARETPEPLAAPGLWSPNRHCRLVEAADGWLAVNLPRSDDRRTVPAWLGGPLDEDPWGAVIRGVRHRPIADLLAGAILLQLPVAVVGETRPQVSARLATRSLRRQTPTAIDLSALWAGPYCAALLAECGVRVIKVAGASRPDPTSDDPKLNGGKTKLTAEPGSEQVRDMIAGANILVTSARPHALARLGITPDAVFAANPDLIWVAITAHGWSDPGARRVGFGDDCAAAGGLVDWHGGEPRFIGDALADPLTGLVAATRVLQALGSGGAGLIDMPLAGTAASFARR